MNRIGKVAMSACAAVMVSSAAYADVTLNSVRVGAVNTVALARFYQSAFGMQEVNRLETPGGPEIFVNFGATVDAAKANKNLRIVIMHRDSDATSDPIPHVILNVTDMACHRRGCQGCRWLDGRRSAPVRNLRHDHRHRCRSRRQPGGADPAAVAPSWRQADRPQRF
jgi:hypothetical protein